MKINLIGMILNNCGRRAFDGAILDDNGKPMSAADSLHTMILEYAKVIHGGESSLVTTSREVTAPATQEHRRDHAFQGPPMTSELTKAAQQALDTAPAPAVPSDVLSLPKYRAWLYVKEHGEWPKGIDRAWMKDDMGRHNDSVVAREVIQELAAALTAAPTPPAQGEKLVRFCPGCGSVGDVPDTFRDCCPDGSNARMIPEDLATRCHDLFLLALAGAKAQQPAVPESADSDEEAQEYGDTYLPWGFTVCRELEPQEKRLMSMLIKAFGSGHPAIDDMAHLILTRCGPAQQQPAVPEDVRRDAERWRKLVAQHEGEEACSLSVFGPGKEWAMEPVGSMPGELDAVVDALPAIAAMSAEKEPTK